MAEEARLEKEDFERTISLLKAQKEAENQKMVEENEKKANYALELKKQIEDLEKRRMSRNKIIDMGDESRRRHEAEKKKLEEIKQQKLAELERAGVPAKYRAELARYKVLQAQTFS